MVRGENYAEFSVSSVPGETNPCDEQALLPVGATCHTFVRVAPVTAGTKSARIQMNNAVVATMSAVVLPGATYSVSPDRVAFDTPLGAISYIEIAVKNTGTLAGTPSFRFDGAQSAEFSVGSSANEDNPCTPDTVLGPNDVCHTFVTYTPVSAGSKSTTLMIYNAAVMIVSGTTPPAL
jgi:hypothetical protein